ncbi:MAG TPA: aminoacyl-tRNA hydrolase [Deltaproteobacteria bacterium]|nr:aminoacyl-tRNA hydrolase [Deltaproteobacteria bacterium]
MRLLRSIRARLAGSREQAEAAPDLVIVGLGNPGPRYEGTRHNVGFRVVEELADRHAGSWQEDPGLEALTCRIAIGGKRCLLVEPLTFMNRSGRSVRRVFERWSDLEPSTHLLVVEDDLDLPTGRIRLRPGGGAGGHRGLGAVLDALGTKAIARLRFGIGRPDGSIPVMDWVLAPFPSDEEREVLPRALGQAADAIEMMVREGRAPAMAHFNAAG